MIGTAPHEEPSEVYQHRVLKEEAERAMTDIQRIVEKPPSDGSKIRVEDVPSYIRQMESALQEVFQRCEDFKHGHL